MNTRQHTLQLMKIAGYHADAKAFTRLCCESKISREASDLAYYAGVNAKKNGQRCSCNDCLKAHERSKAGNVSVWIDEASTFEVKGKP
jgi:hypothetical protein